MIQITSNIKKEITRLDMDENERESALLEREQEVETVRAAQIGDGVAVASLYDQHKRFLYAFVYAKVGNREEAEDLTQEIWLKVMNALPNFKFGSKFRTWLCQVGKFTIADYWRRVYKQKVTPIEDWEMNEASMALAAPPVGDEGDDEELAKQFHRRMNILEHILRQLPDHYREVLEFRFVKNYSLKQTAAAMARTETNIKVLQFRALKKANVIAEQLYGNQ